MSPLELVRTPLGGFVNHKQKIMEIKKERGKSPETIEVDGPNCEKILGKKDNNKITWILKTRKPIKAGEELTLEYNLYKP